MMVERLPGGPWSQNAFLVMSEAEAVFVDPGGGVDGLLETLRARNLKLKGIVNTHGHFDHIGAVHPLQEATGAPFYISGREVPIMKSSNLLRFIFKSKEKVVVPTAFIDLDAISTEFELGGIAFQRIETPGHTPGGHCFLVGNHLFSGDTILRIKPGSADLPGGDAGALAASIDHLRTLPQDLILHPGHGRDTTLGEALEALTQPAIDGSEFK